MTITSKIRNIGKLKIYWFLFFINKYVNNINTSLSERLMLLELIAPNKEDTPDKCKLKIAKSTDAPECDWIPAKGG